MEKVSFWGAEVFGVNLKIGQLSSEDQKLVDLSEFGFEFSNCFGIANAVTSFFKVEEFKESIFVWHILIFETFDNSLCSFALAALTSSIHGSMRVFRCRCEVNFKIVKIKLGDLELANERPFRVRGSCAMEAFSELSSESKARIKLPPVEVERLSSDVIAEVAESITI